MKTLILKKNMKSRSNNRLQTSDPPDDWVNGSWTVDCKCGVTFDDGEEMVDCDECGVWVHTRCFRFAKGEKSFSCDKCKINNNNGSFRVNNDSEETEVAQLLVELPTKTIKMSTSNGNNYSYNYNYNYNYSRSSGSGSCYYNSSNYNGSGSNVFSVGNYPPPVPPPPKRPPNQLWMKPMEERVHVQGVPGGGDDDSLFKGFPIAFASELWKCSGYVPKKFNFRYREFPCWEDEVEGKVSGGVDDNVVDKGAGVLYSLSKENVVVSNSMSGGQARSGGSDRKGCKDRKLSNGNSKKLSMPSLSNKDKGMCRPIVIKRSREELGLSKDHSEKKKIKVSHREQDSKKDKGHDSKAVVIHSTSAKQADVYERKAHKVASNAHLTEGSNIEKPKRNAATDEGNLVLRSSEVAGPGCSSEKRVKVEKPRHDCVDSSQKSAKTETAPLLDAEKDGVGNDLKKKEGIVLDVVGNIQGPISECQTSDLLESKAVTEDVDVAAIENNSEAGKDVETTVLLAATTKSDSKGGMDGHVSDKIVELDSNGLKLFTEQVPSPGRECDDSKLNEANATSSNEDQDDGKILESLSSSQPMKDEGIVNIQCNNKLKCEGSENPTDVQRIFSDSKEVAKVAGEASKLIGETLPPSASQHKVTSARKSSLSSSTNVISKSSLSDKSKAESSQFLSSTGKRMSSNSSTVVKKESAVIVPDKDEDKYEKTKSMVKDHSKSSTNSMIKASQSSKSVTNPLLKRQTSLGKDSMKHPPSKKTSIESGLLSPGSDEPGGSRPTEQGSNGQNKNTSAGQHRGEKALQSSSKSTQFGHPPPSSSAPAGLSDEELALLLHQELNSSPRVPRIPRVRHTGSLPQLSSASATSIFVKRTTSSGGKEQQTFSRRKNKDGSRSSRDPDSEARKVDRAPSSPDSVKTSEALAQAEVPSESTQSVKKNAEYISTSTHSGPSSIDANELISSSTRGSPNNNPEDDTGTNNGLAPIHRTLPGLLAEIMGEGRRMTYEELCNAVLPHWQNLRKHNGERYAYSSHCQAVLDCLRNRSEWARLVDRGPKTSTIRKKHKIDVEPPISETEDGEDRTRRTGKSKSFDSNKEVFPKGRRKARKRRRLALRGRGVRDDGKRTKVEIRSEDSASVSNSSEDTGSSEDDSQESGMDASKSEVSASSAETTAACWS